MAAIVRRPATPALSPAMTEAAVGGAANKIVVAYMICVALSSRFALDFFGLTLFPSRLFLLVMFVPALLAILRTPSIRVQPFDYLVVLFAIWTILALIYNNGFERGIKYGGSLAAETLGGYLLARAYVRNFEQMARILAIYIALIAILGLLAVPESVLGIEVFRYLDGAQLQNQPHMMALNQETRLGLHRAMVSFDHPIQYGVFCATCLGLAWYCCRSSRLKWIAMAIIAFATFFALSSAPLLACGLSIAFITWERLTRPIQHRAAITLGILVAMYLVMQTLTNRTVVEAIIPFITLDPWTGYFRVMIWQVVTANLADNPIFGLGLNEWVRPVWMPPSVDCYWLVMALTGGLPAVAMVTATIVTLLHRVHKRGGYGERPERLRARFGWTVMVFVLAFQAFTVHYWGGMNSFFFFVLGLGAWMTDSRQGVAAVDDQTNRKVPVLLRRSRTSIPTPALIGRDSDRSVSFR